MNYYKVLNKQTFTKDEYSLVPIRFEDRLEIMKWRNEQLYHLRQTKPLTESDQEDYFKNVISKLFDKENPEQILFSYLEEERCIGYGGLVHINWNDKNAEISFIMNTQLENESFQKHWASYLVLIEEVAFEQLQLHKVYTYAFDLRPHLYKVLELNEYQPEAVLKEHCLINGDFKNVVIHAKTKFELTLRKFNANDKNRLFEWSNDELTRSNSFNTQPITFAEHSEWFDKKLNDKDAFYYVGEMKGEAVGIVRFDKTRSGEVVIGVLIDKKFRGKKLAAPFLRQACKTFQKDVVSDIWAYIKSENKASIKAFEKAGFVLKEQLYVNDILAVKLKLENCG